MPQEIAQFLSLALVASLKRIAYSYLEITTSLGASMRFLWLISVFCISQMAFAGEDSKLNIFPPHHPITEKTTRPASPTLEAPAFLAQISGNETTLKWQATAETNFYHLQVATDANFKWLIVDEQMYKNGTEYKVSGLTPGTQYFWRVASGNTANDRGFLTGYFSSSAFETK